MNRYSYEYSYTILAHWDVNILLIQNKSKQKNTIFFSHRRSILHQLYTKHKSWLYSFSWNIKNDNSIFKMLTFSAGDKTSSSIKKKQDLCRATLGDTFFYWVLLPNLKVIQSSLWCLAPSPDRYHFGSKMMFLH